MLACLYAVVEPSLEPPDVDIKLVDRAVIVNINPKRHSKTYGEYCDVELTKRISNIAQNSDRLDLAFDIYRTESTKSQTRASQWKSSRVSIRKETPTYEEFDVFLTDSEKKRIAFQIIGSGLTASNSLNQAITATNQQKMF